MKMSEIKLSIIVVSYNEADYLPECLDSILNQKVNFDYEVIVADDGSSDNSIEIIESYEKKYSFIKHFVQDRDPNLKIKDIIPSIRASTVTFSAMEMAQGKYLNIISGDDYFVDENHFQRAVEFLEKHKVYAAYISNFYSIFPNGTKEFNKLTSKSRFSFWHKQYIHCSCFCFRKLPKDTLLENFCDDCGLQYSIALNGKLKYTEDYTFAYRQREKSIMHSNDREALDVLEMLLFQDCLNNKKTKSSRWWAYLNMQYITYRHFKFVFLNLYKKRGIFEIEKYIKYYNFSKQHNNDVIGALFYPETEKNLKLLSKIIKNINKSDCFVEYIVNKRAILLIGRKLFSIYERISNKIKNSQFASFFIFLALALLTFREAQPSLFATNIISEEVLLKSALGVCCFGISVLLLAYLCTPLLCVLKLTKKILKKVVEKLK